MTSEPHNQRKTNTISSTAQLPTELHSDSTPLMLSDFDFFLPPELIAQTPSHVRSESRLLHVEQENLSDNAFSDLPSFLSSDDLIIYNDTKVIKARLMGEKESGGKVEALIERVFPPADALAHLRANHAPKAGSKLIFEDALTAAVLGREDDLFRLHFDTSESLFDALAAYGRLPLPPYIERPATKEDETRYQTVFARHPGAVAAPTAGLHFDESLFNRLDKMDVERCAITLHVGAGTFQPIRTNALDQHVMHSEQYTLTKETREKIIRTKQRGGRIVAVGTTTLRALESAASEHGFQPGTYETRIFIRPGYTFKIVDRLITNFHLPKTTLLILVSAFAGKKRIQSAYEHAINQKYRFFSYGDAMLLEKAYEI